MANEHGTRDALAATRMEVTVENCAREPIHVPGLIQPHGALIAFDPANGTVLHTSSNLGQWLSTGPLPSRGRRLSDLLGEDAYAAIMTSLGVGTTGVVRHDVLDIPARADSPARPALQMLVHLHRNIGFVELFEAVDASADWMQEFADALDSLRTSADLPELISRMALRVKRLTGFDRVMVYQFKEDWHGHVIADAREPEMEDYFDLHYPASDIPSQARELYRTNLVRFLPDAKYTPVAIQPWIDDDHMQLLDMSQCLLRSVSPIHLRYLGNMGARGTLTISLLVDGVLWGLIACHHRTTKAAPLRMLRACSALSVTAGFMVSAHLKQARADARSHGLEASRKVLNAFAQLQTSAAGIVEQSAVALMRVVDATGGAFWDGDHVHPFGQWPDRARAESILRFCRQAFETTTDELIQSDRVQLHPPLTADELRVTCGLMAVKLDEQGTRGMVWLRPAYRQEVSWGGDPDKPMEIELDESGQPRLCPRSSFARWVTLVQDRSRAWDEIAQESACELLALRQTLLVRDALSQLSLNDRRFRGLVDLQSDAYWRLDGHERVVTLSRALPQVGAITDDITFTQLLGQGFEAEDVRRLATTLGEKKSFKSLRLRSRNRTHASGVVYSLSGEVIHDAAGRYCGWHGTASDVTSTVIKEETLWIREQVESLVSLSKSRFLTHVSHELREPMNALLGVAQVLQKQGELGQREQEWVGQIRTAGWALREAVSGLVNLAELESEGVRLNLAPTDVVGVIRQIVDEQDEWTQTLDVKVSIRAADKTPLVLADPYRLRQALRNIVHNAARYNRPGGTVDIVLARDPVDAKVRIEIRDSGVGIDPARLGQMFQSRDRTGRKPTPGRQSGIGLMIARLIIELMGGRIEASSEVGKGSCFTVFMPIVQAH